MSTNPATSLSPAQSWFNDARFGIFIHWGIYAVNGKDASWSYFNHRQPWASSRAPCPIPRCFSAAISDHRAPTLS